MSDTLMNVGTYLWVALILYYFIQELLVPRQGTGKWVAWAVGILLLLFIVWLIWKSRQSKDEENEAGYEGDGMEDFKDDSFSLIEPDELEIEEPEKGSSVIPSRYRTQKRNFNLLDEVVTEDSAMTYDYFKTWYLTPGFLEKYTEAIKIALKVKMNKLSKVRKQYSADLAAIKSKAPKKDGIANILNSLDKNDDRKLLETTVAELDDLMKEIRKRYSTTNVETTRKCLMTAVHDSKNGIESLTGRTDIKNFLALQLYTFAQNPRIFFSNFQNMAIYGGAGLGKTKLAQVVGHAYASSGILVRKHVHIITKQSLTTAYVNESAKMTRKLLLANLESVVFIDEAYDLTPPQDIIGRSIDHGHEAIAEMVNFMDKMVGISVIVVAGYEDQMEARFMTANEGLPRRFPHKLSLTPYNSQELTHILIKFIVETCPDVKLSKNLSNYLYTIVEHINKKKPNLFKNQAGDMSNLSACVARAIYGTPGKVWPKQGEDILLSGVNSYLASKGQTLESVN